MNIAIRASSALGIIIMTSAACFMQSQETGKSGIRQEPSLTQTEKWIEQTFEIGAHVLKDGFQHIEFVSPDKFENSQCYMHFFVTNRRSEPPIRVMQIADLADIDPTSITVSEVIHDKDIATLKDPDQVDYSTGAV